MRPSLDELFDQIVQNYSGFRRKSGEPYRRMDIDALLEFEDARFGCGVPLRIPFYITCQDCRGRCISGGFVRHVAAGAVERANQVILEILPGARDGERYELNLEKAGITDLLLSQNHFELNDKCQADDPDTQFVEDSRTGRIFNVVGRHPGVRLFQ